MGSGNCAGSISTRANNPPCVTAVGIWSCGDARTFSQCVVALGCGAPFARPKGSGWNNRIRSGFCGNVTAPKSVPGVHPRLLKYPIAHVPMITIPESLETNRPQDWSQVKPE